MVETGSAIAIAQSIAATTELGALALGTAAAGPVLVGVLAGAAAAAGIGYGVHKAISSELEGDAPRLDEPYWVATHKWGKVVIESFASRAAANRAFDEQHPFRRIALKLGPSSIVNGKTRPWREFRHDGPAPWVDDGMRDLIQELCTP